jgi:hypothetical protein
VSKKRKNAGEGYGYMFSGAFAKKSDAEKKERSRKGSFVKGVYVNGQHRYAVLTPRTNPVKRKKKAPKVTNPTELMVMAANPHEHEREITVPPGTTITIRTNPANPDRFTSAHARARGLSRQAPGLIQTEWQRRIHGMAGRRRRVGASSSMVSDIASALRNLGYSAGHARKAARAASGSDFDSLFRSAHEHIRSNPEICGAMIGGEPCTRKTGHRGPHLPQGATMRPRSRLRPGWRPNPTAAAIHERFTGREGEWVKVYEEPCVPAGDYAQLGELLALYFKPTSGGQVQQITFPQSARPLVVSDETARQIYFVGGDQALEFAGGLLGEVRRIDYKQRKEHVADPELDEWKHSFGEESGVKPALIYDAEHKRLLLKGGEYRIESAGIIN